METIKKIKQCLDNINMPESRQMAYQLFRTDTARYYELFKNVRLRHVGGGDNKPYIIKYKGSEYTFYKNHEKDVITYALYKENNINAMPYCIYIENDKKNKRAIIESLGFDKRCYTGLQIESLEDEANGSTLLKIAMALIVKIKDHYGLKTVQLKDNARKLCKTSPKGDLSMSALYMFTRGDTWYGSYGFIPYDSISGKKDKLMIKAYNNNKHIAMFTKVGETKINEHMKYAIKKLNLKMTDNDVDAFLNINKDMILTDFFSKFLEKYDIMCGVFSIIIDRLMLELNMTNLHGISYFIKLR